MSSSPKAPYASERPDALPRAIVSTDGIHLALKIGDKDEEAYVTGARHSVQQASGVDKCARSLEASGYGGGEDGAGTVGQVLEASE